MADEENEQGGAKKSGGLNVVGLLIIAALAGAAGFGGSLMSMPAPDAGETGADDNLPGESIALDAFVLTMTSTKGDLKAAKVQLTLELNMDTTAEAFQVFVPRVRDALLSYLRSQKYENISNNKRQRIMAKEMLDAVHAVGGEAVAAVLVQDLVVQ